MKKQFVMSARSLAVLSLMCCYSTFSSAQKGKTTATKKKATTTAQVSTQVTTTPIASTADQEFLRRSIKHGLADVEMARMALQKSTDSRIRSVAQDILNEHSQFVANMQRIGTGYGIAGLSTTEMGVGRGLIMHGTNGSGSTGVMGTAGMNTNANTMDASASMSSNNMGNTANFNTSGTTGVSGSMGVNGSTGTSGSASMGVNTSTGINATGNMNAGGSTGSWNNQGTSGDNTSGTTDLSANMVVSSSSNTANSGNLSVTGSGSTGMTGTGGIAMGTSSADYANNMYANSDADVYTGRNKDIDLIPQMLQRLENVTGDEFNVMWTSFMISNEERKLAYYSAVQSQLTDPQLRSAASQASTELQSHRDVLKSLDTTAGRYQQ